jgi:sugar phosphate isomerase/epimerase
VDPDRGLLTGMSVCFLRDDLETATRTVAELGFEAMEVYGGHLGPGMPGVASFEGHAAAAGALIRRHGLVVSTLNVVGVEGFDPFGGTAAFDATVALTAGHLRLAAALGSPRILVWEGRVANASDVPAACATLARCFEAAAASSGLAEPPRISVELHPFTFGLAHSRVAELARALVGVGAGICFDFCHFGVALGDDLLVAIDEEVLRAINHVHYSDSDLVTSELHFPPGDGRLDLDAIGRRLKGRGLSMGWDLFGWPSPRHAMETRMDRYRAFVRSHAASSGVL